MDWCVCMVMCSTQSSISRRTSGHNIDAKKSECHFQKDKHTPYTLRGTIKVFKSEKCFETAIKRAFASLGLLHTAQLTTGPAPAALRRGAVHTARREGSSSGRGSAPGERLTPWLYCTATQACGRVAYRMRPWRLTHRVRRGRGKS